MITFEQKGDFRKTQRFLSAAKRIQYKRILERYGRVGVKMLEMNTPVDTGNTAASWGYEIEIARGHASIYWTNSNIQDGVPIAVILQYGHGTKNGGYVTGRDYINPALKPVFEDILDGAWKEITRL